MKWAAALLVLALGLSFPAGVWADDRDDDKDKKAEVEGIISAVDVRGGVIVVRGEKGRTWVVVVHPVTAVKFDDDDDDVEKFAPAGIADLQVGDEVEIKGLRLSDGRLLALKVEVEGARPRVVVRPRGVVIRGVIVVVSSGNFILVTQDGNVTVIIRSGTRFVKDGRSVSRTAFGVHDVVLVKTKSSGGRLMADEVELEFDADDGIVLSGIIATLWLQGGAFLLVGTPTWINVTSRTFIIHGRNAVPASAVRPNGSVVIYGMGKGSATQAMVIVVR